MLKEACRKGMKVYFGRTNGERTLGEVVKLNPTKAKVRTLEQRGNGRGSAVGTEWGVPYSMMTPAEGETVGIVVPIQREHLTYNPFTYIENLILEAILSCYSGLSPENLSADGEASITHIRTTRARLERQLRGLQAAYGRQVDEAEVYGWHGSKTAYENARKKQA
jgi:hypothetical protein